MNRKLSGWLETPGPPGLGRVQTEPSEARTATEHARGHRCRKSQVRVNNSCRCTEQIKEDFKNLLDQWCKEDEGAWASKNGIGRVYKTHGCRSWWYAVSNVVMSGFC